MNFLPNDKKPHLFRCGFPRFLTVTGLYLLYSIDESFTSRKYFAASSGGVGLM